MLDPTLLALIALVVAVLALLLSGWLAWRLRRASHRAGAGASDGDVLIADAERLDALAGRLAGLAERQQSAEQHSRLAVQRVGVVRFNPFEDTGGNQSFALAMLDADGNGFVLSSLHSRQQTRVYLKPITAGKSDGALSDEETEALRRAGA
jgi:hypothetical protein